MEYSNFHPFDILKKKKFINPKVKFCNNPTGSPVRERIFDLSIQQDVWKWTNFLRKKDHFEI